ncbi:general odorant-binding protein 69a-like [Pararge aegeria]|uniref:Jg8867 protein n=1 Tax=Pararge aegeria aegeria TaxID=348720 RepID=A0A8S4R3K4_9NEOP|nr:general odorant-binding protein 69a-like [Pararge aegeria]CAH2230539.1 jg8867 [Pararge aegeria aegeria]
MDTKLPLCVVISCFIHAVLGMDPEMAELAKMLRDNCVEETGVDVGLIDKVNAGADLMPDGKLKCYIKCVMETAGMMSGGEVDVEAVVAVLPEELQKHADTMRGCGTQKGADDCDTAFKTQACWQQGSKSDYILI